MTISLKRYKFSSIIIILDERVEFMTLLGDLISELLRISSPSGECVSNVYFYHFTLFRQLFLVYIKQHLNKYFIDL